MTVETPKLSDVSPTTDAPKVKTADAVTVKDAGEGAAKVKNPFESFKLQAFSQEEWDTKMKAQKDKAAPGAGSSADKLIARAKQFIGTPYKWGGTGPLGFDCSGFTQFLYRELGIDLPRISAQQSSSGKRVGIDQLRPGDLVLWDNSSRNNGADHVAIYIGNGQVIHAPKPGDAVKISTIWDSGHAWGVAMNL